MLAIVGLGRPGLSFAGPPLKAASGLGFRVWFRVWGLGFGVYGLGMSKGSELQNIGL